MSCSFKTQVLGALLAGVVGCKAGGTSTEPTQVVPGGPLVFSSEAAAQAYLEKLRADPRLAKVERVGPYATRLDEPRVIKDCDHWHPKDCRWQIEFTCRVSRLLSAEVELGKPQWTPSDNPSEDCVTAPLQGSSRCQNTRGPVRLEMADKCSAADGRMAQHLPRQSSNNMGDECLGDVASVGGDGGLAEVVVRPTSGGPPIARLKLHSEKDGVRICRSDFAAVTQQIPSESWLCAPIKNSTRCNSMHSDDFLKRVRADQELGRLHGFDEFAKFVERNKDTPAAAIAMTRMTQEADAEWAKLGDANDHGKHVAAITAFLAKYGKVATDLDRIDEAYWLDVESVAATSTAKQAADLEPLLNLFVASPAAILGAQGRSFSPSGSAATHRDNAIGGFWRAASAALQRQNVRTMRIDAVESWGSLIRRARTATGTLPDSIKADVEIIESRAAKEAAKNEAARDRKRNQCERVCKGNSDAVYARWKTCVERNGRIGTLTGNALNEFCENQCIDDCAAK